MSSVTEQASSGGVRGISDLRPKMKLAGTVKKVELFGAFVDVGVGREGLVHISRLRQGEKVNRVEDVVKEGDAVEVWVHKVDMKSGRIELTMIPPPAIDWGDLAPGQQYTGRVRTIEKFGAFVDFGGPREGLVPVGAMARERINSPADVVQPEQEVTVWVTSVDPERQRISLSLVEPPAVSWESLQPGQAYTGKVVRMERFGAFVDIGAERPGLLHVREMGAGDFVRDPSDVVKLGEEVDVRIREVDRRKRQIDLTMKGAAEVTPEVEETDEVPPTAMELALRQAMGNDKKGRSKKERDRQQRQARRREQEDILARTLKRPNQ
jgi:ribosomal protein S1